MTLYLLKFNNYYNRIIKRYETIAEYLSASVLLYTEENVNFNPNDGVYAEQILNYSGADMPDYLLVESEGMIIGRWFVIEAIRTRGWQFKVNLYRDLISEWYNEVISAPCFIEKARVSMYDPAIYNNEDLTYNQIKKSEKLIKDKSKSAWYVGYIAKNTPATTVTVPLEAQKIDGEYSSFGAYAFDQYKENPLLGPARDLTFKTYYYGELQGAYVQGWDKDGNAKRPKLNIAYPINQAGVAACSSDQGYRWEFGSTQYGVASIYYEALEELANYGFEWTNGLTLPVSTQSRVEELLSEVGKIYKIANRYYEIGFRYEIRNLQVDFTKDEAYGRNFVNLAAANDKLTTTLTGNVGSVEYETTAIYITYTEVFVDQISFTLPGNRASTSDAPYDIFAIPESENVIAPGTELMTSMGTSSDLSKRIVDALIVALGSNLYDIQLLPFAPLADKHFLAGPTDEDIITLLTNSFPTNDERVHYQEIKPESGLFPSTVIIYATESNFNKTVSENLIVPTDPIEFKVSNECDVYRLVSPNYNGQFEFSLVKNMGVTSWNISTSFKPFSPYIRIAPNFGGLYGRNFEDARGLVCGGDFSIAQISDAWTQYQIQNKNYQVMFDRQIQNMEVNNSVQRFREKIGAITGTAQGATSGAMVGMMTGNPYAALAGGIIGGSASGIAGIADIKLNEQLRREALDYSQDQFGYQLQNIQALPYSLTKVGAQNNDYKLFPFLEFYTCSDTEKQALRDKIKYNGMTIMRIGTIEEFMQPERSYIKGKLIRLETISDDYHIVNMISKELNEGVFI